MKLLDQGSPTLNETLIKCFQAYTEKICTNLFRRVVTDLGMCYTFNMQSHKTIFNDGVISTDFNSYKNKNEEKIKEHWTLEGGFLSTDRQKVPYRAIPGQSFQFFIHLNDSDRIDLCTLLKNSYKVIFHLPNEIPTLFHNADFIQFDTETVVRLSATAYTSKNHLKKVPINLRQCYFEGEKTLKFFSSYTKDHCNFECLANFTLRRCDCVKFSYPRTQNTRVCDLNEVNCILKAHLAWPDEDEMSQNLSMPCDCYPPCFDIHYKIKQRQSVESTEKSSIIVSRIKSETK